MAMDDVEAILAQMTFAFGAGAGTISLVNRDALEVLRERWRTNIERDKGDWGKPGVATMVLAKFQMMGRLAAGYSLGEGRLAISSADVTKAIATAMNEPTPYC